MFPQKLIHWPNFDQGFDMEKTAGLSYKQELQCTVETGGLIIMMLYNYLCCHSVVA